jgi:hypothetical protein
MKPWMNNAKEDNFCYCIQLWQLADQSLVMQKPYMHTEYNSSTGSSTPAHLTQTTKTPMWEALPAYAPMDFLAYFLCPL